MSRSRSGNPAVRAWSPMVKVPEYQMNPELVEHHLRENASGSRVEMWVSDLYQAVVVWRPNGSGHISFKRHDRSAVRDWRHFQAIKNEIAGPEREAVELFPRESRLLDEANQYHLWVWPEGQDVPTGYIADSLPNVHREAREEGRGRQRAMQPGLPVGTHKT